MIRFIKSFVTTLKIRLIIFVKFAKINDRVVTTRYFMWRDVLWKLLFAYFNFYFSS